MYLQVSFITQSMSKVDQKVRIGMLYYVCNCCCFKKHEDINYKKDGLIIYLRLYCTILLKLIYLLRDIPIWANYTVYFDFKFHFLPHEFIYVIVTASNGNLIKMFSNYFIK